MVILRIGMAEGEQAQLALLAEPQDGGRVHQRLLTKQQGALMVIQTPEIDRLLRLARTARAFSHTALAGMPRRSGKVVCSRFHSCRRVVQANSSG